MIEGEWKSDGLDAQGESSWSLDPEDTDRDYQDISLRVSGGSPMNLQFTPSTTTPLSKFYFQINIVSMESGSGSLGVGVARSSEFRTGYNTKGMFYNGNLTNGGGALKVSYGPRPKQGDTILVEYTEVDNSFRVCFHVNGKSLGIAFLVPKSRASPTSESFLPCFHVQGDLRLKVTTSLKIPTVATTSIQHPLEDDWSLIEAIDETSGERIWPITSSSDDFPSSPLILHMEPNDDQWILAFKVCNTLRVQKVLSELAGGDDDSKNYEISGPNRVLSTRMMPPPPLRVLEPQLFHALGSQWKSFLLERSDTLVALSEGGVRLATFQRVSTDETAVACTSYDY